MSWSPSSFHFQSTIPALFSTQRSFHSSSKPVMIFCPFSFDCLFLQFCKSIIFAQNRDSIVAYFWVGLNKFIFLSYVLCEDSFWKRGKLRCTRHRWSKHLPLLSLITWWRRIKKNIAIRIGSYIKSRKCAERKRISLQNNNNNSATLD